MKKRAEKRAEHREKSATEKEKLEIAFTKIVNNVAATNGNTEIITRILQQAIVNFFSMKNIFKNEKKLM